jgi:hypothetical protein
MQATTEATNSSPPVETERTAVAARRER